MGPCITSAIVWFMVGFVTPWVLLVLSLINLVLIVAVIAFVKGAFSGPEGNARCRKI